MTLRDKRYFKGSSLYSFRIFIISKEKHQIHVSNALNHKKKIGKKKKVSINHADFLMNEK